MTASQNFFRHCRQRGGGGIQLTPWGGGLFVLLLWFGFAPVLFAQAPVAKPSAASIQSDTDVLIKAAKAEGELVFYSAAREIIAKRTADAFHAKYGVKANFVRMSSTVLTQRYATEAAAGNIAADLILNAGSAAAFADEGIKKGWVEVLSSAGLPVMKGEFPATYIRGATALVQVQPWLVAYNRDKVKGADIPKEWADILNPKWKGQIIVPDPRASDAYFDFWALLHDRYGDSFFARLRAQNPRFQSSGATGVQSLGAGEASLMLPQVNSSVTDFQAKGAPVDMVTLGYTTGVEMQVMLTARKLAKHPNAARLFANYVMSKEGNTVLNADPGGVTMYDTSGLPKEYHSPKPDTISRKDQILKLLGVN